jgi:photosystem II stability/assembly factor-like uncharacterized protein
MKRLLALGAALLTVGWFVGDRLVPNAGERTDFPHRTELGAHPFDAPDLAEQYYRAKRVSGTGAFDPRAAYRTARSRLERMPVYSTRRGERLSGDLRARSASTLDAWTPLGPGNIGGRTRTLVIHPKKPKIMYAAGVSGGIWKSTSNGNRWKPIADDLTNIAVNVLVMDPANPDVLFAGTGEGYFREEVRGTGLPLRGGGIFKTEDAGDSWTMLASTTGSDFHWVNDLVVSHLDSNRIYAATRRGVFRSTDAGASWRRVLKTNVQGGCLDLVARTDLDNDYLLVSCGTLAKATVYRNAAAEVGSKWKKVLTDGPAMGRTSLAIAPSDQDVVYALSASNVPGPGGEFEQALHAVYRSDQGGAKGSWRATTRNTDARTVNTLLLSNPIIAVLTQCGFQGPNENFAMGWYVNTLTVDPRDPDRVWAAGVDFFRSDDGGESWNPVTYWWSGSNNPNFVHADQHGLVFHPKKKGTAFALCDGGVYRTKNADGAIDTSDFGVCSPGINRVTWSRLNRSYGVTQFYHGTVYPDGRSYIAGAQDNGTVLGTDRGGENGWVTIQGGDGGYSAIDPSNTNVVYATIQNGVITKSTDGGFTFFDAMAGIDDLANNDSSNFRAQGDLFLFISPLEMDPNDSDRLWSGGLRLWRTDDAAANWAAASTALNGRASAVAVAPGDSDLVVVGTEDGFIYRSDSATSADGNSAWSSSRPRSGFVSSIAFDPADTSIVYATYAGFGGQHVWQSTDAGASWQAIDGSGNDSVPDIPVHSLVVDPGDSSRLFLGTDLGVLASTDGGSSWAVENTGFATAVTEWLAINEGGTERYLFAFTHGRGAWRVPLDG